MSRTSMDSVPRRTRSRWDEFFRVNYAELKRERNQESGGNSGRGKRVTNASDSNYTVVNGEGVKSGEKFDSAFTKSGEKNIEHVGSYGRWRSRNVAGAKVEKEKRDKVASEKKRKLDMREKVNGEGILESDDAIILSDEQVISNGSSVKTEPESRSGSGSKVDHLDEVVSSIMNRVGSANMGADSGGKCGRGSPRIKPLDEKQMHRDVSVDFESPVDSESSDGSDDSDDSESESTSEEDDEFSDKDYKAGESSASASSDDSSRNSDFELEKDDEEGEEKLTNVVEDKRTPYSCKRSTGMVLRKEIGKQEEDDESDKGYNVDDYVSSREGSSDHQKTQDGMIVIDEKEFHSIRKSGKQNQKGGGGLDGYLKKRDVFGLEDDKEEVNQVKCLRPSMEERSSTESSSSTDNEHKSSRYEDSYHIDQIKKKGWECSVKKGNLCKKKSPRARELDLIKILVDSINAGKDHQFTIEKKVLTRILPSKFRFEDEVVPPPEKSEWEKHIDLLFRDLELGLRESEMDCTNSPEKENDHLSSMEINETPAACCGRGEHLSVLDEQIGIVCKYCHAVILDIKHVLPPFCTPPLSRRDWKESVESPSSFKGQIQFPGSDCETPESTRSVRGTVWELIPGIEEGMFPHQREGFEFIWKNIAGGIIIDKLKQNLSGGRGCIISHAPGTGKTRLTIAFLQTFLKLYPASCPVIIAPRGMLLNWESEFLKWNFNIPFHNMNNKELSGNENAVAIQIWGLVGAGILSREAIRLLKLYSWIRGGGILGVSYTLFEKLAGENVKEGLHKKMREVLLERPGLLVLDEGHTPRNDQSLIWKALSKVSTQRRIILSGTPFQNNLHELYNTLCLVNPKFVNQIGFGDNTSGSSGKKDHVARKRWTALTSSIGKTRDDGLKRLRVMLDPFVHVHKGTILEERIPGLRHTVVFLHPTDCQKTLLETSSQVNNVFHRIRLVSLVSVHPLLMAAMKNRPVDTSKLQEIESDVNAGVKMKFLMKLIWLADAVGERVLVFSQFLDPLLFIKKQIESHLSWREGRELLYMDGQLDEKQRQDSISSFNDDTSKAKLLLASQRACSEGINLVGASRVVLLDTVWNPSVEKQAISRAYRLGQKKIVHVYRLFTSGIEVRLFAQQIKKVQLSELIFSPGDGQTCLRKKSPVVSSEDKVLEAMLNLESFNVIFEKIIYQPNESHLIDIFGLEEQN